jgi:hypothetical protein
MMTVDTDTVFVSSITAEDVFVDGTKPRVTVTYGANYGPFWTAVPRTTFMALGKKQPFRAMTYFPVVIKTSHLRLMREHIQAHMKAPSFDEAMSRIVMASPYSQFNIMITYLWWFKREDYYWDIMERTPGWTGPIEEVGTGATSRLPGCPARVVAVLLGLYCCFSGVTHPPAGVLANCLGQSWAPVQFVLCSTI